MNNDDLVCQLTWMTNSAVRWLSFDILAFHCRCLRHIVVAMMISREISVARMRGLRIDGHRITQIERVPGDWKRGILRWITRCVALTILDKQFTIRYVSRKMKSTIPIKVGLRTSIKRRWIKRAVRDEAPSVTWRYRAWSQSRVEASHRAQRYPSLYKFWYNITAFSSSSFIDVDDNWEVLALRFLCSVILVYTGVYVLHDYDCDKWRRL